MSRTADDRHYDFRKNNPRRYFSTFLRIVFATGVTLYVFWLAGPAEIGAALGRARWSWILAACLLVIADRVLMAYRWIALLAPVKESRPPLARLVRIFFVSTFVGSFLPASVGSDAVRTWSLAQQGVPQSQSLASVLLDRLLGVVSLVLSAAVGLALAPRVLDEPAVVWAFGLAAAGCAASLAFVFSTRLDDAIRQRLGSNPTNSLRRAFGRLLDALLAYRAERQLLLLVLLASLAVQALRIAQAWMLGHSLGIDAPLSTYVAFIPLILLVMLLPVTISGIGTSQLAFAWTFTRAGVQAPDAVALSVLFVALGIVGNLPGGWLYVSGRKEEELSGRSRALRSRR